MELLASSRYGVKCNYPLELTQVRTLNALYQPLIGHEGVSLYLTLCSDVKQLSLARTCCPVNRILKVMGMSLKSFNDSLKKLEALQLVKTYIYKDQETFLFEINPPLEPLRFMENSVLNTLLKDRLGEEDYNRTIMNFKIPILSTEEYQDISSRFGEVFEIVREEEKFTVMAKSIINRPENRIFDWDYKQFEEGLATYQIPGKLISDKLKERIIQLGSLYRVDPITMLSLVRQSYDNSEINVDRLAQLALSHYDLVEPVTIENAYRYEPSNNASGSTPEDRHIHYLKTSSPFEVLQDHQGGMEPVKRDLKVIESVMSQLGLNVGVMNVLIEFTLMVCDNKIVKNFMEAHGASWRRYKIETVEQAIDKAREYKMQGSSPVIEFDSDLSAPTTDSAADIDIEDILDTFN